MRQMKVLLLAVVLVLIAALATGGCRRVKLADAPAGTGGATDQSQTVPIGAATSVKTAVRMGVGTLKLSSGEPSSTLALDATFTYPQADWKPAVAYSVEATRGALSVSQPDVRPFPTVSLGTSDNSWTLKLAPGVPTDLSLKLGVGESTVDLRDIDVTSLEVISGVGKATVDLSGPRTHDLSGRVEAGVGEVDIIVPSSVGVRLVGGTEGIGELRAPGFTHVDGGMVNAAWNQPGPKIELALTRGVGDIKVTSAN